MPFAAQTPAWFSQNLQVPFRKAEAEVRGCRIQYAVWGDAQKPGIILVHGGLAHWQWWQFLAPFWSGDYCLVALDISGHGASEWRDTYDAEVWAEEIVTAIDVAGLKPKPLLVGHSLGGLLSLTAAAHYPQAFSGLVIVDSPILDFERSKGEGRRGNSYLHVLPYPNLEMAKKRFRLVPSQPVALDYIFDFLAEKSLKRIEEGWIWKFDPKVFVGVKRPTWVELFPRVKCPMAFIRGEHSSIATRQMRADLLAAVGPNLKMVDIPEAHHHVMLDQPIAMVAAINSLLAAWNHV